MLAPRYAARELLSGISDVAVPIWRQMLQQFERACHDED
jgi:hypothetical protein